MQKAVIYSLSVLLFILGSTFAQTAFVSGTIKDTEGNLVENASIGVKEDSKYTTYSNEKGFYKLTVPANTSLTIVFNSISHFSYSRTIFLKEGEVFSFSPTVKFKNELIGVEVTDTKVRAEEILHIDPKNFLQLPSVTGNIEDIIKTQIGVSSNNELSSGYTVRGGNFDENLIYVNDIEVYRPFLVRSGQQEGLSFANPYMVQNINFSAGGFEAKYGDKLSSVLDITYRKPLKFAGNASASFLGGNAQVEGISNNRLVAWSLGARYRTNSYLLKTFDTKGEYRPSALDVQTFITFDVNPKFKVEMLGNVASNKFLVIPASRQTNFGTVKEALRLTVYFDGQELMQYETYMLGVSATYRPKPSVKLKFISSAYRADERELYTVQGQYYIDQLEADLGKPNFGQVAYNRGIGTFLNNGRNNLNATVYNFEHKGTKYLKKQNELLWGAKYQLENINDKLSEWKMVDSAGFTVPYSPVSIDLTDVYKTKIGIASTRMQAYTQYNKTITTRDSSLFIFTAGIRGNYWTFNEQLVISPRITLAFKPNWKRDWLFKFSSGIYNQPPFYRELRNIDGNINQALKAQQSLQFVLTSDYNFYMWKRPFKLIMAAYYKEFKDLVAYEVDNVRIRYFANNRTKGYSTGADFRINGEFVKGVESWATLGILRTYEYSADNIHYLFYNKAGEEIVKGYTFDQVKTDSAKIDPGYIPRPTDQLVSFGMFFQDYIPSLPWCKFNLNLQFGTGRPFGPPTHKRYQQTLRMPPYRRVDAGFAFNVLKEDREFKNKNAFNHLKDMWIFVEVFNLLAIQNTVSYTWVQDVTGNRYAVPNYLTNRQINLRLQIRF
ncbi:MAG: TonB-dependent receptor plug domain-containing protein [Bacteroidia bacterium]|nr:TonB-dependent receptor plug domain-containing protein [Bacteroidia bacterium]